MGTHAMWMSKAITRSFAILLTYAMMLPQVCPKTLENTETKVCRDRYGYMIPELFNDWTCAQCYMYLFQHEKELSTYFNTKGRAVLASNGTTFPLGTQLQPDALNATQRANICKTLNDDECERWTSCCKKARECCDEQLSTPRVLTGKFCPRTWDGYGCFKDTVPGSTARLGCPSFIQYSIPSVTASKLCSANGTWYSLPENGEWTNYTACIETNNHKIAIFISVACNGISILVLIPAVAILISYRQLHSQNRIKLHLNFFTCFIVSDIMYILWNILVYYDRLNLRTTDSLIFKNTPGCKLLHALTKYTKSATYMWMFLEGYYLHRLIVKTFEQPKSLLLFYIIGWGFPLIPTVLYSVLRIFLADESCWSAPTIPAIEWAIYTPNLLSLFVNMVFLFNILRILLTQLQAHPNEPSNYRRAIKATFILIPPFGIQMLIIIYRPNSDMVGADVYYLVAAAVESSQGFFVALVFCFCNGEVHTHLQKTCAKLKLTHASYRRDSSRRSFSLNTLNMGLPFLTGNRRVSASSMGSSSTNNNNSRGRNCRHNSAQSTNFLLSPTEYQPLAYEENGKTPIRMEANGNTSNEIQGNGTTPMKNDGVIT